MQPVELQQYLHDHIPLSAAMGAVVVAASTDSVVLTAPLAPNISHRETAFGGSVSALAILAAWSLVHLRLAEHSHQCRLVIQRNAIEYEAPIHDAFTARSSLVAPEDWSRFLPVLERHGRSRVRVASIIESGSVRTGWFEGDFVAIDTRHPTSTE